MSIGSTFSSRPKKDGPEQKKRALQWQVVKPGEGEQKKFGKNISIVGESQSGKTVLMLSHGFYNSKYLPMIERAEIFPYVVKALKGGFLPEVNEIVVLESENNLQKALYTPNTLERTLFKPFLDDNIITIIPYIIQDDGRIIRDGKVIDLSRENVGEVKLEVKNKMRELVDIGDEGVLYGIDSATKFKKILDKGLKFIIDTIQGKKHVTLDGIDKFSMLYYADRNNEWDDIYSYIRGYKGWNVQTFKEKSTPDSIVEKYDAEPISTKWVKGTEFFMDVVWRITRHSDNTRTVEPLFGGRNLPQDISRLKPFRIPLESRFAAMPLLDRMCEKMVEYGEKSDESFWSV